MAKRTTTFESDVKMYGTQTMLYDKIPTQQFESDVKMYGTQTFNILLYNLIGLRVM